MGVFGVRTGDRRGTRSPRAAHTLLSAHEDVALALQEPCSQTERLHRVLGIACRTLGFDLGAVWRPGTDGQSLTCAAVWHHRDPALSAVAASSLSTRFARGRGLPGYAWQTGIPAWVATASWDPRLAAAPRPVLQSAVAVPIGTGTSFEGVLELFCVDRRESDPAALRFLGLVAAQLNQALAAWRTRDALARRDRALVAADSAVAIANATLEDLPLVYVNPAFERLTGYRTAEVVDRPSDLLLGDDSDPETVERLTTAALRGEEARESLLVYRKDGLPFWDEVTVSPVSDREGRVVQVVVTHRDVTDRRIAEEEAEFLRGHDPITGLPNRVLLNTALDRVVDRAGRHGLQVALIACSLEGLRDRSDADTDELLTRAGERLVAVVRPGDLVARHNTHELSVVMADLDPEAAAERAVSVAQRIDRAIAKPFPIGGGEVTLTCSIAVSMLGPDEATPVALLARARAALADARSGSLA